MKKLISMTLVAMLSVSAFSFPAYASTSHVNEGEAPVFNGATSNDAFGDLIDWSGVVFGNANDIIDVEGTLAVGGNFKSFRGFSVNSGAAGCAYPASTDNAAFLVNGNVNIPGDGNVYGQTVIGNAEGNTYHLSNVTASADTTNGKYTVADTAKYFADAKSTAYAAKEAVDALAVNGVCEVEGSTYTFKGNTDADVLVYDVAGSAFSGYVFDFNIAEGQTVVVNLTASGKIDMKYGACRINGNMDPNYLRSFNRNIIINLVNSTEIGLTSTELYGILLAPDADLTGNNGSVCGTSIVNNLTGIGGFELHVGFNDSFVPYVPASSDPEPTAPADPEDPADPTDPTDPVEPTEEPKEELPKNGTIRIDVPLKMAVAFADGTVYYGGEMKEIVFGQEYTFQMCSVNWDNGVYDENGNGLRGSVVYRMIVLHQDEFNERAAAAKADPERYTVKGIDIIDNEAKIIIVNGDAKDTHLETDVNNFFMAYRFHFQGEDYDKKTGITNVINTPLESLSVNLPLGSTVACDAYIGEEKVDSADVFIAHNSGEGVYDDVYLTSVNDYTWAH